MVGSKATSGSWVVSPRPSGSGGFMTQPGGRTLGSSPNPYRPRYGLAVPRYPQSPASAAPQVRSAVAKAMQAKRMLHGLGFWIIGAAGRSGGKGLRPGPEPRHV